MHVYRPIYFFDSALKWAFSLIKKMVFVMIKLGLHLDIAILCNGVKNSCFFSINDKIA